MAGQNQKLTRRELYDLVWKTPVDLLGKQFGLSGRGVGKICERYSIPVPPHGYWAKARTGKRVVRPPLLEIDTPAQAEPKVPLTPTPPPPAAAEPTPEATRYEALRQQLLAEIPPLTVPAKLHKPHPLITRWLEEDERAAYSPILSHRRRTHRVAPLTRRRLRLLNSLFKALEERGFKIEHDPRVGSKFQARLEGNAIRFQVQERIRQVRRDLTAEDHARHPGLARQYVLEKQRTGELSLTILNYLPAWMAAKWQDQKDQKLEGQVREILADIIVAAYENEQAKVRAAAERTRREEQKQKWDKEREEKLEQDRRAALLKIVKDWWDAGEIRAFVAALRQAVDAGEFHPNAEIYEPWLDWALERANRLDPIVSGWSFRKDLLEKDR